MELNFENALKYIGEIGLGNNLYITSMQRRFLTGYIVTAKMIDELESKGYLAQVNYDTKGRKILKLRWYKFCILIRKRWNREKSYV